MESYNNKKSNLERDLSFMKNKTLSIVFFFLILSCFHNNANGQSYSRTATFNASATNGWVQFDWGANCKNLNTIVPSHALNISVQITMTGGDFDLYTYNSASCPSTLLWTSRPFLGGTSTETVSGLLNYCNSLNTTIAVRKTFAGAGSVTITVTWTVPSYTINSTTSLNETFNTTSTSLANWLFQANVSGTSAAPSVVASGTNVTTSPQEGDRMVSYNSFNISAGGQSRLISPTLNTTGTGANGIDLEFYWRNDNGYTTSDDRVQVQYSTDNGCTWVNSGPTFSRYNASAGAGTWNFQSVSIGTAAVGTNVRIAFLFTSQYGNNCFLDNVTVKQRCFNGNVATFGSNVWNAYCYSSGDNAGGDNAWNSSTVRGMYTMSTLNFDTRTGQSNSNAQSWGDGSTPSNASGYSGCSIDVDFHSYIFKRQGFPCGTYQLNLPSHDDMAILLVDGVEVWRNIGCCATRTAVWTGYLGSTSTVELRITEGVGGSHGALELIPLTISATVTPTNPISCGGNGSISISNPQNGHNMAFRSDLSALTGVAVSGNAAVTGGELILTPAANSQTGSAILTPASRTGAWTANYSQFIGSGSGADGMSFTYGPISGAGNGEQGWASGLVVSFDTYTTATNSQLNIYWNGSIVWQSAVNVQNFRTSSLIPVKISVNTSNQLSVTWNSIDLLTNYALPAAYGSANKSTWNYGFSARTGGLNDAHKVSDVYISSIANLEYSINGSTWSATTPISAPAGTYTVQARPAVGVACPATIGTITITNPNTIDWANLQFPSSASICSDGSANIYGRVYKAGFTSVAGADAGMIAQIGYSSSNTNPNTWTNWQAATYNAGFVDPSNDEYMATLSGLTAGTYYYAMRYKYCTDGAWYYGGYNVGGGGFYNGTTNVNGVLTVNALPNVTANASTSTVCAGAPVTLTGGGANTYTWNNGVTNGVSFVPASSTTYTVSGTSAAGCTNTATTTITVGTLSTATTVTNGDYVWVGNASSVWTNPSNWMTFDGTSYAIASALPTSANNVIIRSNNTCVLTQPASISGAFGEANNVTIETGASLGIQSSESLKVHGNWNNSGTLNASTGSIEFVGSTGNQTITKVGGETFPNMVVNKTSGNVILANNVTVSSGLTLTSGLVEVGANTLALGSATVTGGSSASYIQTASTGVVSRNVSGTVANFPVGNGSYNPATITNTGTADIFSVRVIDNVTTNGTGVGATTTEAVVKRTWMISEATTGGSNATLRLYWNGGGEEINSFSAATAFMAHYVAASSMWDNIGGTIGAGYVETSGNTSFSPFTISSSTTFAPLPVELMSLEAQCANENVIVSWKTASEHNTLNFVVERSENGTAWNEIQTVVAAGNSNTVREYAIEDAGAARGLNYYRLIQIDQDGVEKIYGPVMSNCGSEDNIFMSFPNPSDAEITLVFNNKDYVGQSTLTVRDANGRVVRSLAMDIQPGTSSLLIPDMDLIPGVYYLQLEGVDFKTAVIKHSLR